MIGSRIAKLRQHKGLSQAQLGQRVNVSGSTIGMYEQGRRIPAGDVLIALARELDVSTDYLLKGTAESLLPSALLQEKLHGFTLSRQELVVLMAAMLMDP